MYKLVAIDLDGTMLNSYGIVTENTKKVLREKIAQKMEIVIASGRTTSSILPIVDEIGGINYFIAGNGALIYDIQNKKVVYDKFIPKAKILEIIKICEENSIFYTVYTENEIITKTLKYNVLYYHKENLKKEESKQTKIKIVEDIPKYIENNENNNYLKIMICDESQLIFNAVINKIKKVKNVEILDVGHQSRKFIKDGTEDISIEYYYTEITLDNVDKWTSLEYLIGILNIDKSEIIAIGDNENDKKMIQNAKLGIAMGQSSPKITEIADIITDTNDEDGVAKILEKI